MNLGLFNRMNLKESNESNGMYGEWTSISLLMSQYEEDNLGRQSILEKIDSTISKEITLNFIKQFGNSLGSTQPLDSRELLTDKNVQWSMEIFRYGLSLPFTEHEAIKDCVNVYCEWLTVLLPEPKSRIPECILDDPNVYARKMISHLRYLFTPRNGEGSDLVHKQAVLCHRVLRTLQEVTHTSKKLNQETWEALLVFLLTINDILLSPPPVKDDVADQLCERVLSVLFEIWLIACSQCFPSPTLWKTLHECCMNWRHRVALIEQWNRINLVLSSKILLFMYGPEFPKLKIGEEDIIPNGMSKDCITQCWYRFLNIIGNPISLTKPEVISQTQKFLQFAISSTSSTGEVLDPSDHPCLQLLPSIFLKAIRGISGLVDAFLGIPKSTLVSLTTSRASSVIPKTSSSNRSSTNSSMTSMQYPSLETKTPQLAADRANCNTILHLYGEWLFEAALLGCDLHLQSNQSSWRPGSIIIDSSKTSSLSCSQPGSLSESHSNTSNHISKYESGKAEALGTLCRIFCSKKTGEEILPVYIARFYMAIYQGLKYPTNLNDCDECMAAILINSKEIFSLDLDGARSLIPSYMTAIDIVLTYKNLRIPVDAKKVELRRAAIHILLSLLVLPLHFQECPIKELSFTAGFLDKSLSTFIALKPKLINILINALQIEEDSENTYMLLGGLFLLIQDSASYEASSAHIIQHISETNQNLLSSAASDTSSTISLASNSCDHSITPERCYTSEMEALSSDSAHTLFVRVTYLVCHRLISFWKTDWNIALAALELLSGLARIHIKDATECKRAVKWLCDYIIYQCSRPPPAHSKDLHSTIVAAFYCVSVWLCEHPYILKDKDYLITVLEVCEYGICGSKSVVKPGELIKMKEDKDLKPVSMRVKDAAENLLTIILEHVSYFPNECGPESVNSLLNEVTLLRQCSSSNSNYTTLASSTEKFKYFVTKGNVMLTLLEEPLGNDQDPQPTVTLLIRSPFGRYAWTMQLRHLPRHRSTSNKTHSSNACRPVAMQDMPVCPQVKQKYFPDGVENAQLFQVDSSIPTLENLLENNLSLKKEANLMNRLIERQVPIETHMVNKSQANNDEYCTPPPVCHEFQTARLFLSHFGFLHLKGEDNFSKLPNLVALDSSPTDFAQDLENLDQMSSRTVDTVHIYYVKSQQTDASDIVANILNSNTINPYFFEFIHSLGWPVDIHKHPGWTGHISTSWKITQDHIGSSSSAGENVRKQELYDGTNRIIYWADASSEIAFVIPSSIKAKDKLMENKFASKNTSVWNDSSNSWSDSSHSSNYHSEGSSKPEPPKRTNKISIQSNINTKIMVVWLESFEDHLNYPVDDLLESMKTGLEKDDRIKTSDVLIIFLQLLTTGLLRVHLRGPIGRAGLALPLIDGMIVSRRTLGLLIRYTALNMARRRRLDSDNYQSPHVRRRLKIQEIVEKYKRGMTKPELLTYLFSTT